MQLQNEVEKKIDKLLKDYDNAINKGDLTKASDAASLIEVELSRLNANEIRVDSNQLQ